MTTPPPGEGTHELADMPQLSHVQATDALLDRLAARTPSDSDLADPIVADLVRLAQFADEAPTPDLAVARLIEVLEGRPLYMFPRGSQVATEADEPIQLEADRPAARMIDVSDPAIAVSSRRAAADSQTEQDDDAEELTGVAARSATPAVTSLDVIRAVRAANARRLAGQRTSGWQGVVQQMALPAASVVIIALLGGGVSAVVTGDPMSPINGVTGIASQLPGLDGGQKKVDKVSADIARANLAVRAQDKQGATRAIRSASDNLQAVPEDKKPALQKQIAEAKKNLTTVRETTPGVVPPPGTGPQPTPTPTPTASNPVVPTTDPSESAAPPSASASASASATASATSASGGDSTGATGP